MKKCNCNPKKSENEICDMCGNISINCVCNNVSASGGDEGDGCECVISLQYESVACSTCCGNNDSCFCEFFV